MKLIEFQVFVGWGSDEKAIIAILGHRNAAQRQQIRQAYQDIYQEDLIKRLESELSGDFEVYTIFQRLTTNMNTNLRLSKLQYDINIFFYFYCDTYL